MRISDWSSDVCSSDLPLDRLEARRDLAVHRVAEVGEMFVAAGDLDVEHVAQVGVEFDRAGEAVARGVDGRAGHEAAEHLRTDTGAFGVEIGPDGIAGGFAGDDLVILVPPFGAERERGVAEAEVEIALGVEIHRHLAIAQAARIELARAVIAAERDVDAVLEDRKSTRLNSSP